MKPMEGLHSFTNAHECQHYPSVEDMIINRTGSVLALTATTFQWRKTKRKGPISIWVQNCSMIEVQQKVETEDNVYRET